MKAWVFEAGSGAGILTVVDHASNRVPTGIELAISPSLLETHIGWDIGAAALARALSFPRFLANVSRLVIDFNRDPDASDLIPRSSDGITIPGHGCKVRARIQWWHDYHHALAQRIIDYPPALIVSLHSFTPKLTERPLENRPWEVGILYNRDDRAARVALQLLASANVIAGDQLPYSGKVLNVTMNRHAEANGIPYLGVEVRQDLIEDAAGVARWTTILKPIICACLDHFAPSDEANVP